MTIAQDLRFGLRLLIRNPGYTAVAALSIGLGIGINTMTFSGVNSVLLKPLPVDDPARVVSVFTADARAGANLGAAMSRLNFLDFRAEERGVLRDDVGDGTAARPLGHRRAARDGAGPARHAATSSTCSASRPSPGARFAPRRTGRLARTWSPCSATTGGSGTSPATRRSSGRRSRSIGSSSRSSASRRRGFAASTSLPGRSRGCRRCATSRC